MQITPRFASTFLVKYSDVQTPSAHPFRDYLQQEAAKTPAEIELSWMDSYIVLNTPETEAGKAKDGEIDLKAAQSRVNLLKSRVRLRSGALYRLTQQFRTLDRVLENNLPGGDHTADWDREQARDGFQYIKKSLTIGEEYLERHSRP